MKIRNDNIEKLTFTASGVFDLALNPLEIAVGESGNALVLEKVCVDYSEVTSNYVRNGFFGTENANFIFSYSGLTSSIPDDEYLGTTTINDNNLNIDHNNSIKENNSIYLTVGGQHPDVLIGGSGTVSVYIKYDRIDF